jgi:putative FmdB family regulatory protein
MPIYEYHCEPCEHSFETLIRGNGDAAHCPKCGSIDVAKQFSVPASAQTNGSSRSDSLPICAPSPGPMGGGCGMGGCGSGMCGLD